MARDILETVVKVARTGVGVLLVEQNAAIALALADRAYVLDEGVIKASGSAAEIGADPQVKRSYLAV